MDYQVDFLKENELEKVQKFINDEWKESHILSKSKKLFNWQYQNKNKSYNFIISKKDNSIIGILGFIPTSKYDKNLIKNNVIWLALWKVSEKIKIPGIGLKMLIFLQQKHKHNIIAVNGINKNHPPMYKALGFKSDKLLHYYVTNKNAKLGIIKSNDSFNPPHANNKGEPWKMVTLENFEDFKIGNHFINDTDLILKKSPDYFLNRYIKHPFYKYKVFTIASQDNKEIAFICIRFDTHNDIKILRIVDYYGNTNILKNSGKGLNKILEDNNAEYADFWLFGIHKEIIESIGFQLVDDSDEVVVPSYFEPFLRKNITILFSYKDLNLNKNYPLIFKADGDQDRPNFLSNENY